MVKVFSFALLWLMTVGLAAPRAYGLVGALQLGSNALKFSVLSSQKPASLAKDATLTGSGDVGGQSISLATGASTGADTVANPRGITLGQRATVAGACVTTGTSIKLRDGASCASQDTSGSGADLTVLSSAIAELANFQTMLATTPTTQTLTAINLPLNGSMTITDTIAGQQNIISMPSVTLKKGATLELSGGPSDTVILEISGKLKLGSGARITLTGGLTAAQVLISTGGKSVSIPKSTALSATLLAPFGKCTLTRAATVNGAILCSGKVTLAAGAQLVFTPFTGPVLSSKWVITGSLNVGRQLHTSTVLQNGQVLIAGGLSNENTTVESTAELYDAAGTAATFTGSMATGRAGHTATLLQNGDVLIAAGEDIDGNGLSSAEIYDPSTGTFSATGSLNIARKFHTATLLVSGKVLLAGGDGAALTPLSSAEVYDPVARTFTRVGDMNVARDFFVSRLFTTGPLNGEAIVAGGSLFAPTDAAELFDPVGNTFSFTGSMSVARRSPIGAILSNGTLLVAAGDTSGLTAEIYDPTTGAFTLTGAPIYSHRFGTATVMADGMVALVGGQLYNIITSGTDIYNSVTGVFTAGPLLNQARNYQTASLLNNGRILVTGGGSFAIVGSFGSDLASAELLQ
jgi:hypothetical protein